MRISNTCAEAAGPLACPYPCTRVGVQSFPELAGCLPEDTVSRVCWESLTQVKEDGSGKRETPSTLTLSNACTGWHIPTATHMHTPTCMRTHKRPRVHTLTFQFNCMYMHVPLVLLRGNNFPPERRCLQMRTTLTPHF